MNKLVAKTLAGVLVLTVAFLPVQATTATAQAAGGEEEEEERAWLDVEVRVIEGQPVLVIETEEGYEKIPFSLPEYAYADGQRMPFQTEGNNVLVPTEDGPEAVALKDFDVTVAGGQILLVADGNPIITVALVGLGIKLGAKYFPILAGVKATPTAKIAGGTVGGAAGAGLGVPLDLAWIMWE